MWTFIPFSANTYEKNNLTNTDNCTALRWPPPKEIESVNLLPCGSSIGNKRVLSWKYTYLQLGGIHIIAFTSY